MIAVPIISNARTPGVTPEIVSGAPDVARSRNGNFKRWQQREVTIHFDASLEAIGPGARDAVQQAFGTWLATDAQLPSLTFDTTQGASPSLEPDGLNTVLVAPIEFAGHRNDLAITISFSDSETGEILEADIVINARRRFGLLDAAPESPEPAPSPDLPDAALSHGNADPQPGGGPPDGDSTVGSAEPCAGSFDLQNVATHEAGHLFGLGEDREEAKTTMFYRTGRCETHKRTLEESDSATVSDVYAGGFEERPEVQCTAGPVGTGGRAPSPGWMALALLGLLATARRSARRSSASAQRGAASWASLSTR